MQNKTLAVTLTNWEVLSSNLLLHLAEVPTLVPNQLELAALIEGVRAAVADQVQTDGKLRDIIARRQELTRQANHLQQYITAVLRRKYGASSPQLLQFGVRPRALRRPSASPENPDETPAPPPSDS